MKINYLRLIKMLSKFSIYGILLQICFYSFLLAGNTTAQNKSVREVYIQVNDTYGSIEEVFKSIESQTDFEFAYSKKNIAKVKEIQLTSGNRAVDEVLLEVSREAGLRFKQINNSISVNKVVGDVTGLELLEVVQTRNITGKVTGEDGEGLPGVNIILEGSGTGTISDVEGNYSIEVPTEGAILVFSSVGYLKEEITVANQSVIDLAMILDITSLEEIVVVGYGVQKKESLTGAISTVSSSDLDRVHGSTVSATLAGKLPGVSFRMPDGRPGAGAAIQIRNMGNPLYVIDGIQKDGGQFNNLAPNDIESITILKDASAAIYGVRAANGVVVVTTKRGKKGTQNQVNVDAYYGWQNWTRFPETVNAYEWQLGKAYADMNRINPSSNLTPEELAKWQEGTEYGYRTFDWYDFIIKPNSPQTSINVSTSGGSDKISYYLSLTRLDQNSVLGREFTFARTNLQSNIDAQITDRFKVGMQLNGRIESRDNPGVPGGDDYWAPRFALFRNRPYERPYANDNPEYINDIGHMAENWGLLTKEKSGYWHEDWRVMQMNFNASYDLPIEGLSIKGMYSYYFADRLMNGHEYTYDAYTYFPDEDEYRITFANLNPWRERGTHKVFENVTQLQLDYIKEFGRHSIAAVLVNERIQRRDQDVWVHSVPNTNALPLLQFADMDTYNDTDETQARIGYIGRFNYNFANKYYVEFAGRYDGSWKFSEDDRWGFFPSASVGWRITEESFIKSLVGDNSLNIKIRGSYGELGDDDVNIGAFDYMEGYNYATSKVIIDGQVVTGARDRGVPITSISWFTSKITDIGVDYSFLNGKISGAVDYFYRKRDGLRGRKYDVLVPDEIGYDLPDENVNSDATTGGEVSIAYTSNVGDLQFSVGGNVSYARNKFLNAYKPTWGNSWDYYRNSSENRWTGTYWGYEVIGQFESFDQINSHEINNDGQGNKSMLPGDLIYKDINEDGLINDYDVRPIGYPRDRNPILNFGFHITADYKGFDISLDFSGGSMYSYNQGWEMRWPYQNGGNLLRQFYDDRYHREDPFDLNSQWIPGKYPALRFNDGNHNNYNKNSDYWLTNAWYLRARTLELGYTIPDKLLERLKMQKLRFYVNSYNLFSFDNLKKLGVEPEIMDENGLQYPQNRMVNVGINLSF